MKKEIYKINISKFLPVLKDKDNKVLTEAEVDSITQLNEDPETNIEIYQDAEEVSVPTWFINMGEYMMMVFRDPTNTFTCVEFTNNLFSYKSTDTVDEILAQFNV